MARQVTIRNVSPELARRLKTMAEGRQESVNTTVLRILDNAVGLDARRERLRRYMTATDAEAREFEKVLRSMRTVDPRDWE